MAARRKVRVVPEVLYGTFNSAGLAATGVVFHLRDGSSSTVRPKPIVWVEPSAAGSNRPTYQGSEQISVVGAIQTDLFPSQAGILVPLGCNLTGTILNLPSFTLDEGIVHDDMTSTSYGRTTGCMVESFEVVANNSVGGTVARLNLGIIGKQFDRTITVTDFAEPTFASTPGYPLDDPYVFQHLAGNLTIDGARTGFRDFKLSVKNKIMAPFDEGRYIRRAWWGGREVMLEVTLSYNSDADRQAFEDQDEFAVSAAFDDGVKTLTFDLKGRCSFTNIDDDLPMDGEGYYQKLTMRTLIDTALSPANDFSAALTTNP